MKEYGEELIRIENMAKVLIIFIFNFIYSFSFLENVFSSYKIHVNNINPLFSLFIYSQYFLLLTSPLESPAFNFIVHLKTH